MSGVLDVVDSVGVRRRVIAGNPAAPAGPIEGRLGLHVTEAELAVWRVRAVSGPYRVAGDAATNSPGDWARIVNQADQHVANQWTVRNPTSTPGGEVSGWHVDTRRLRSAAFLALVRHGAQNVASYVNSARTHLVNQAATMPWTNRSVWPLNAFSDTDPTFGICEWLCNYVYAYDYLCAHEQDADVEVFTPAQHLSIQTWLYHAADLWQEPVNRNLTTLWGAGRHNDPPSYVDRSYGTMVSGHNGSQLLTITDEASFYNNRRAQIATLPAIIAVLLEDRGFAPPSGANPGSSLAHLAATGRLFFEEALKFACSSPPTWWGDGNRWTAQIPNLGLAYGWAVLGKAIELADTFARKGDTSLYSFGTTYGQRGTQTSFPKTIRYQAEQFLAMTRNEIHIFGSNNLSNNGAGFRINMQNNPRIRDIGGLRMANYYANTLMTDTVLRRASGAPAWPASPQDPQHWEGSSFELPGACFMFADTGVNPYGGG